jgi:beta-glucosidase
MVLLRNERAAGGPVLPLDPRQVRSVALVGPLAEVASLGDRGSSQVRPPRAVTPAEGLRAGLPLGLRLQVARGLRASVDAARACDAVVAVVGLGWRDEGEWIGPIGGDRRSLRLPPDQESLLRAVSAVNPRSVAVVVAGGPVVMEAWRHRVAAVLMAWYPGMEGGHALADVLFGAAEPGGRLPAEFPAQEAGLPPFDPRARTVRYDRWHGYRLRDHGGPPAAYPFGFGLGYTTWALDRPHAVREGSGLRVDAEVANTGGRRGATVVQAYVGQDAPRLEREVRRLGAFQRVELDPGCATRVSLVVPEAVLASRDHGGWVLPGGPWRVEVGFSSHPDDLVAVVADAADPAEVGDSPGE